MTGIIVTWSFFSFLYFKVIFDALFRADLSIISSLLLAVVFGAFVFMASGVYAAKFLEFNWTPGRVPARVYQVVSRSFWPFIWMTTIYIIVSRLIIFGFSKKMSREIDIFDYKGRIEEELILFIIIIIIPSLTHYVMCVFSTYHNANQRVTQE